MPDFWISWPGVVARQPAEISGSHCILPRKCPGHNPPLNNISPLLRKQERTLITLDIDNLIFPALYQVGLFINALYKDGKYNVGRTDMSVFSVFSASVQNGRAVSLNVSTVK